MHADEDSQDQEKNQESNDLKRTLSDMGSASSNRTMLYPKKTEQTVCLISIIVIIHPCSLLRSRLLVIILETVSLAAAAVARCSAATSSTTGLLNFGEKVIDFLEWICSRGGHFAGDVFLELDRSVTFLELRIPIVS